MDQLSYSPKLRRYLLDQVCIYEDVTVQFSRSIASKHGKEGAAPLKIFTFHCFQISQAEIMKISMKN